MKTRREGAIKGAAILTAAGLFVKVLGMLYKIPLTNRLSDDGMGYFNAAYTVYTFFFVLSCSGLPSALALSVAKDLGTKNEERAYARFAVMKRFSFFLGLVLSLLLFFFAVPFAKMLGSPRAALSLMTVSPALFFTTLASVYRGYHQGRGTMLPSALSQMIEGAGKLIFGLLLLSLGLSLGISKDKMAAYAILGLSFASFLCYLLLAFSTKRMPIARLVKKERRALLLDTVKTSLPITLSALATTLVTTLDLLLLMQVLQKIGYTVDQANAAWGNYSALVLPLFHMPQVLITPIAISFLPCLRRALSEKDDDELVRLTKTAVTITALLSLASALGLALFSRDVLFLLYTDEASVMHAYPHLSLLAIALFPFGLSSVLAAILQARGRLWVPTVSLVIGSCVKLCVTLFCAEAFGEAVAPLGTLLSYTISAAISAACFAKDHPEEKLLSSVGLPFAIAVIATALGLFFNYWLATSLDTRLATLLSIALVALVTLGLALVSGILSEVRAITRNTTSAECGSK